MTVSRHPRSTILVYGVAFAAALGLHLAGIPLAWLLGTLIVTAACALAGMELRPPLMLRWLGQLLIGATVGLHLTPDVVGGILPYLPLMFMMAVISVVVSTVFAVGLARFAGLDTMTSYFASLPGGLAEMSNVGPTLGARSEPIAVIQTIRAGLVVLLIPPLLVLLGPEFGPDATGRPAVPLIWVPVLLGGGCAVALLIRKLGLNNPWMIGSLLFAGGMAASQTLHGTIPLPLFQVAQYLVAFAVGARFQRQMLGTLLKISAFGVVSVICIATTMACIGLALAALTPMDVLTGVLSTSPGGVSEMAATAQTLHLPVALVVGFHISRTFLVNGFAVHFWHGLNRVGLIGLLERRIGPRPGR